MQGQGLIIYKLSDFCCETKKTSNGQTNTRFA